MIPEPFQQGDFPSCHVGRSVRCWLGKTPDDAIDKKPRLLDPKLSSVDECWEDAWRFICKNFVNIYEHRYPRDAGWRTCQDVIFAAWQWSYDIFDSQSLLVMVAYHGSGLSCKHCARLKPSRQAFHLLGKGTPSWSYCCDCSCFWRLVMIIGWYFTRVIKE